VLGERGIALRFEIVFAGDWTGWEAAPPAVGAPAASAASAA
jgi:hypothetical protein